MADFEVIIVGSGCAGAIAAHELSKAGKAVLVVERGNYAGAKNMTGGRLYSHSLKKVFPEFEKEAPLERRITHERFSLIAPDSNFTVDYTSENLLQEGRDSYSILRRPFGQWLSSKAEAAGAEYIYGIAVEGLLSKDGRIGGIAAGGDEITSDIVILADGANSLLTGSAVGAEVPSPHQMAVGIKQVIELPSKSIEDRLLCDEGEGAAWLFVGDATHGHIGGGFMYANKESISLGLVATLSDLVTSGTPIYQMLEDFKNHPAVAPLIAGGKVVEHSGHMVPEGGYTMIPELAGDGVLVTGDAAMLVVNIGYMVRGMDFAIASGQLAAQTAVEALEKADTSKTELSSYRARLEKSFVLQDLRRFRRFPGFMESTPRIFKEYPGMIRNIMDNIFVVDGLPTQSLLQKIKPELKKVGYGNLIKDMRRGIKAL